MPETDIAAGTVAGRRAKDAAATGAPDAMPFLQPILTGDFLAVCAEVARVGRTLLAMVEVIAHRDRGEIDVPVIEGVFTMLALDNDARLRPVPAAQTPRPAS